MASADPTHADEPRSGEEERSEGSTDTSTAGRAPSSPKRKGRLSSILARWLPYAGVFILGVAAMLAYVYVAPNKYIPSAYISSTDIPPPPPPPPAAPVRIVGEEELRDEAAYVNAPAYREFHNALSEHEAIISAIAPCFEFFDGQHPTFIFYHPQLRINEFSGPASYSGLYMPNFGSEENMFKTLKLTNFQRSAIHLSNAITRARYETISTTNSSYSRMQNFQIAAVVIGAITTILISIKSISNENKIIYFIIGILAIIFSSVGTGLSSLSSFYNPREVYIRNERSLSALKQLHLDVSSEMINQIALDRANCHITNEDMKTKAKDWYTRLGAILNASDTSAQGDGKVPNKSGEPKELKTLPVEQPK